MLITTLKDIKIKIVIARKYLLGDRKTAHSQYFASLQGAHCIFWHQ